MAMLLRNGDRQPVQMLAGVTRKTFGTTPSMMLCEIRLTRGSVVPMHQHPHDQVGYVVSGKIKMTVGGAEMVCAPGDNYAIPGNTPHAAEAVEDTVVIDVFSPQREDYR